MSMIISWGPHDRNEISMGEIAKHYGLKDIVFWRDGVEIPEDSLVVNRSLEDIEGSISLRDAEKPILKEKISPDLRRDITVILKKMSYVDRRAFTVGTVLCALRIERCSRNVREITEEILLELGCEVVPRSYDLDRTWYKFEAIEE